MDRVYYLKPALRQGFVEMTIPDKPNSRLQHYLSWFSVFS
ncbi:Fic family protein [Sphingobacterium lumbrici]